MPDPRILGPRCRPAGFSLMELLVVISIIAILMGIIVPTYFNVRESAKMTRAKVTVKNLETALKAYLERYRVWPSVLSAEDQTYEIKDDLFRILRGEKVGADNPDAVVFYEFEGTNATAGALDPWSNPADDTTHKPYRLRVDLNYDGRITVGGDTIFRSVLVWSVGTNRTDDVDAVPSRDGYVRSWD